MTNIQFFQILNQAAPMVWDDFMRIRTITRKQNYNIETTQKDFDETMAELKENWTKHFGDKPLTQSQDMITLPQIPQIHYVAEKDTVVPHALSQKWTNDKNLITVPNATHSNFPNIKIKFTNY